MADIVYIKTAQDFVDLINGVYGRGTSSAYLNVEITADIDMNDLGDPYEFVSTNTSTWYIYLNGNNHTIRNIHYSNTASNVRWTLFYTMYGEIKNLIFKDVLIDSYYIFFIGVTDNNGSKITNVEVHGNIQSYADGRIFMANYVYNCTVTGMLTRTNGTFVVNAGRYIANCTVDVKSPDCNIQIYAPANYITTSFAMIRGCNSCTVWSGNNASLCYFVPYGYDEGSGKTMTVTSGGGVSVLYDSEIAAAKNVTVTGSATAETTAHLHNAEYMAETYGYPY